MDDRDKIIEGLRYVLDYIQSDNEFLIAGIENAIRFLEEQQDGAKCKNCMINGAWRNVLLLCDDGEYHHPEILD